MLRMKQTYHTPKIPTTFLHSILLKQTNTYFLKTLDFFCLIFSTYVTTQEHTLTRDKIQCLMTVLSWALPQTLRLQGI